jgi:hypothetical protein
MFQGLLRVFGVGRETLHPLDPRSLEGRSPKWRALQQRFVREKKCCFITRLRVDLEVHHKIPYHVRPDLELEWDNLCLLTRPVHYLIGHHCNWAYYNQNFEEEAARLAEEVAAARGRDF